MKKYDYLFGPVPSRRLGMSLGIDVVPYKVCTLDCVYCEVGATDNLTCERKDYFNPELVIKEIEDYMKNNPAPDFMTFSGSGEPTLNTGIGKIIRFIKENYNVRLAFLTNGTLLSDKTVASDIALCDVVLPSLDAASRKVFNMINRPSSCIDFEKYIQSLIDFRDIFRNQMWLEVFLLKGYNDFPEELERLRIIIEKIRPDRIQINTLDRPGVLKNLHPLDRKEMEDIITKWGFKNAEIISRNASENKVKQSGDALDIILETISRRPCTLEDLEKTLDMHRNEVNKVLSILEEQNRITRKNMDRGVFYSIK